MSNRFKSALFSGFNRRDVVSYITDQAKQKEVLNDRTAELEALLEEAREALAAAQEENRALLTRAEEAEQRAAKAEETCRGLQQAVRSSLAELTALSGAFDAEDGDTPEGTEEPPEGSDFPEEFPEEAPEKDPDFPEDDTPAEPEPAESGPAEAEEEADVSKVWKRPGDDTPADGPVEEEPVRKRTVEIRRHGRI